MLTTTVPATMSPQFIIDRDAIIALVKQKQCKDVRFLYDAINYEDIFRLLMDFNATFSCSINLTYLDNLLQAVDPGLLPVYNIRHNEALTNLTNVFFVSKCTVSGTITINQSVKTIVITNGSNVNKIHVTGGAQVELLVISGNSVLADLTVDNDGSAVKSVSLLHCPGTNVTTAQLTLINAEEKNVWSVSNPEGTVFGGYVCPNYATTTTPATTTVVGT